MAAMASRSTLMLQHLLAQHLPLLAGGAVAGLCKQMGTAGARQPLAHS